MAAQSSLLESLLVKIGDEGDNVINVQMRLRDLGYFNYKVTGVFGAVTENAVFSFQRVNGLSQDGAVGPETANLLFSNAAKRYTAAAPPKKPTPKPAQAPAYGKMWDWFDTVADLWPRMTNCKVIDFWTGTTMTMVRVGGYNHADVEPATANDTAKLKACYGGSWSWDRRPVLVLINGTYVAASINGKPHGYETVSGNNMNGQVCIHFLNSRTHVRNLKDSDHQYCVRIAAGKG